MPVCIFHPVPPDYLMCGRADKQGNQKFDWLCESCFTVSEKFFQDNNRPGIAVRLKQLTSPKKAVKAIQVIDSEKVFLNRKWIPSFIERMRELFGPAFSKAVRDEIAVEKEWDI